MAKITIEIDTEEQTITAAINGNSIENVSCISASICSDYYKPNKKSIYWNINSVNNTGDDDLQSSTYYSSASASASEPISKAKADIIEYLQRQRRS